MTRHSRRLGRGASEVFVHVRRVVVDSDAQPVDALTWPAALESALSLRLDRHPSRRERTSAPPAIDQIADAIATHVTPSSRGPRA
jgi:hypothetical protein